MITKESILDAAQSLVFSTDQETVSLRKIAAVVGCAPPSIYYYFKNKAAIMQGLGERFMQQALEVVLASSDTDDAFIVYGQYWFTHSRQFTLLMMDNDHKVNLTEFPAFTQILTAFDTDNTAATAIVAACHGIILHAIQHHLPHEQVNALLSELTTQRTLS